VKTTIDISDSLFAEAKAGAESRGITFRQLVEEGLRAVLQNRGKLAKRFRLRDGTFHGRGLQRNLSWPEIRREIYQGRGE
jgi:hypothetical protein